MSESQQEIVGHSLFAGVIAEGSQVRARALWRVLSECIQELNQEAPPDWLVAVTSTRPPFQPQAVEVLDGGLVGIRGQSFKDSTPCRLVFSPDALRVEFGYIHKDEVSAPFGEAPDFL